MNALNKPLVSVVMSSYNHALYVREAIDSVLEQTYDNIEFIINDDGSSDNTADAINKIKNDKIQFYFFKQNQGACASINECIKKAKGKYIALINSDDTWEKDKLEQQVNFLENNQEFDAVFSYAHFKNEKMEEFSLSERPYFYDIFSQKNRSSAKWLEKFFFEGNSICHPSMLIKKTCYDNIGLYNNLLRQLPDFDMWIRFIKHYKLHIMPINLVNFRLIGNENASSPTLINQTRGRNEVNLIFENFFENTSIELFKDAFQNYIINKEFSSIEEYECEKAFLYLNHQDNHYKFIGLRKLYKLMKEEKFRELLEKNYDFTDKTFMKISGEISFSLLSPGKKQDLSTSEMLSHILRKIKNTPKKQIMLWIYKYVKRKLSA